LRAPLAAETRVDFGNEQAKAKTMHAMKGFSVTAEQRSLLGRNNHSLRPLSTAGHLDVWQVFRFTWLPLLIFVFTLLCVTSSPRFEQEAVVLMVRMVGLVLLLATPTISLAVLVFGIVVTKFHSCVRWSAATYWAWWPLWKFVLCLLAAVVACTIGNFVWYRHFLPYQQMQRLQAYNNVNPAAVRGVRMQDAGVVVFNTSAGVDRGRTGCLVNGATYCVAPILLGTDLATAPDGEHDLFMAGYDCCSCPGEFRCGDWDRPAPALGGMRIVSIADNPFYRLAAEKWAATYGKPIRQAIFFEWAANPVATWRRMRTQGVRILTLSLLGCPFLLLMLAFLLNGVFKFMNESGYAAPVDTPVPPAGLGNAMSKSFLPQMHKHYTDQQEQQKSWTNI